MQGAQKAIFGMTKAQLLLNIALNANIIGLVILGIAALVAIVVVAIKHWETWGSALLLFTGIFAPIISMVMAVKTHWSSIVDAFQNGGVLSGLKAIGMMLLDVVLYPLQQILRLIGKIPKMGWATDAANSIQSFREGQTPALKNQGGGTVYNERNPNGSAPMPQPYASPNSSAIANGVRTDGNLDINVYSLPGAASVSQRGELPRGTKLNKGYQ
jgi:hypothetical protein